LRKDLTSAEALLWTHLQKSKLASKKFRRQHSIGRYIVDFYCPECRLAIELDGQVHFHSTRSDYDVARTEFLERFNVRVLRFENRRIFEDLESVLDSIKTYLTTPVTPPEPGGEL
jgi:very-short-patch-repair endonuclease